MRKTRSKPARYGKVNDLIFSKISGDLGISKKQLRAVKKRKELAGAGEFSIQMRFDPRCFLVNPIEDVERYLARFLGVNLSLAIRDRIVIDEKGPDNKLMGPFFNTGGMWQGFRPAGGGKNVRAQFYQSSYSSDFLLAELRKSKGSLSIQQLRRLARERRKASLQGTEVAGIGKVKGYEVNWRNRDKAWSCLTSKKKKGAARGRELLEPTHEEHTAIMAYLEDMLKMRVMIGDVSGIRRSVRNARARQLVKALGKIKAPMIRVN